MPYPSDQDVNLGNSEYARRTKRLIKIIGDIRALGSAVYAFVHYTCVNWFIKGPGISRPATHRCYWQPICWQKLPY
jgi:hypothetical protein